MTMMISNQHLYTYPQTHAPHKQKTKQDNTLTLPLSLSLPLPLTLTLSWGLHSDGAVPISGHVSEDGNYQSSFFRKRLYINDML